MKNKMLFFTIVLLYLAGAICLLANALYTYGYNKGFLDGCVYGRAEIHDGFYTSWDVITCKGAGAQTSRENADK